MASLSGWAIASIAMTAASAAAAGVSAYQTGKAQKKAYQAQAEQDEANARQKALETSINEDTARRQGRAKLANMLAAQGEAGLEGGTATTSYMSSFRNVEQDVMNLRYQGMSQWANYKNQAALNRFYGKQAYRQGVMGLATAGLSGMAKAGSTAAANYTPNTPNTTGNTLGGTSTNFGGKGYVDTKRQVSYLGNNPYPFYL